MARPEHEEWVVLLMALATPCLPPGFYGSVTLNVQDSTLTHANVVYSVKPDRLGAPRRPVLVPVGRNGHAVAK